WSYDLNGALIGAGHMERSEGFDKKAVCLPEIRTEIWNGWIFLTLNPDAKPVAEMLAPLLDVVSRYHMQDYIPMVHEDHVWQTNWKLLTENFMEGY
ncbi:MAG TPA: (2Fe-2S)-binding protein, partial [Rhodobacteraceae bacterium]|nr:(2Fe-2S)-binding protein [Paracoccaceae bacterium]